MKKNIFLSFAFFAFTTICLINVANAQDIIASGNCGPNLGPNLKWTLTTDSVLTIYGTGEMSNFYCYGGVCYPDPPWKNYKNFIKTVIICDGATSVGTGAFLNCLALTSLTIGNDVTIIKDEAFKGCIKLYSSVLGNSLTNIGVSTFESCKSLYSIIIPESVIFVGNRAFYECISLFSITLPGSITTIEPWTFASCYSLTSLILENGITTIGSMTFDHCLALTSITLPESVTTIGNVSFQCCPALRSVTIPKNVVSIGNGAFNQCESLDTIYFNAINCLPNTWGFYYCPNLTTLVIGSSVETIPDRAFIYNTALSSIISRTIPPPTLGTDALKGAVSDIPIYIPCSTLESYSTAPGWDRFTNFIETSFQDIPVPQLCMISVNENNHNEIVWNDEEDVEFFNIYRQNTQDDNYDLVATVPSSNPSMWVDTESNASKHSYSYKVSSVFDCTETILSDAHKTIHLSINAGENNSWNLVWTTYEGIDYTTYNIYRATGEIMSEFELIKTVPANITSFCDLSAPIGYVYYMIEIMLEAPCVPERNLNSIKSNIASDKSEVGIDEYLHPNFTIIPNPATNQITISSSTPFHSVEIINFLGQTVVSQTTNGKNDVIPSGAQRNEESQTINISHLHAGIYFVRVGFENGGSVKKLVKQ